MCNIIGDTQKNMRLEKNSLNKKNLFDFSCKKP